MIEKIDLIESLGSKELTDLTKDIVEVGIDSFLKDGLLKDIPIIGTVINVFNLSKKIKESFEAGKILKFLVELDKIPQEKIDAFKEKLESEKASDYVGAQTLLILSRLNEINKATYIGRLFKLYIESEISQSDFFRLSHIVSDVFLEDFAVLYLYTLPPSAPRLENREAAMQQLYKAGLYTQVTTIQKNNNTRYNGDVEYKMKLEYRLNSFGRIMQDIYTDLVDSSNKNPT